MPERSYGQYCAVARTLDRLGDRWTLLLVRELLLGPKRFKDLEEGLPGIAPNLLSKRLRQLEEDGILRHTRLPPPADVPVYQLTQAGRDLQDVVLSLARWGLRHLPPPTGEEEKRAEWVLLSLRARFRPDRAEGVRETYELRIGEEVYHARVAGGTVATGRGPADDPDLVFATDVETLFRLASGASDLRAELDAGRVDLKGAYESAERMGRLFAGPDGDALREDDAGLRPPEEPGDVP